MEQAILDGLMIGVVVGLVVVVIMVIVGYARKPNFAAPPRRHRLLVSPLSPREALARIEGLGRQGGYRLAKASGEGGPAVLADGFSLFSFGNFYPCFVEAAESGSRIAVGISPRVPQYGPVVTNRLRKIAEAVEAAVEGRAV